ncbi:MAG: AMP-binding protein [Deltaproteobacteria bacterium]|nr:AMP-binding protein [Deltaproteobacteria bacterium]
MNKRNQLNLYSIPLSAGLKNQGTARRDRLAIIDGPSGETITYGALYERVPRIAWWLTNHGIGYGDRVACLSLNSKAYIEFLYALAWIGAVAVPINIRLNPREMTHILLDSGARGIFSCAFFVEVAEQLTSDIPAIELKIVAADPREGWATFDELIDEGNDSAPISEDVTGETLFMLLYTSGTTGEAKGCMVPQRVWTAYAVNMATCFQMGCDDVYLGFLPYFHVAGFGTAISQLLLGGTLVTIAIPDPPTMYDLIEKHRVTFMFLVPGISAAFLYHDARKGKDVSSLKVFIGGAGGEKLEFINDAEEFLGARYYGIYGQTESGGKVTWVDSDMIRENSLSYGYVMPFFDYRIVDEKDTEVEPGTAGELCLRGTPVMQGYWNLPEATAETLKNDWHHTGDLFMQMENGQVRMVDRSKYLIKTGGENVYPQEVEMVLLRHDAIADAAVIGIRDDTWGETVKAFVVFKEGMTLSRLEIDAWVRESIAGYKVPRYIDFVDHLPRNASGKVLKHELKGWETTPEQRVK